MKNVMQKNVKNIPHCDIFFTMGAAPKGFQQRRIRVEMIVEYLFQICGKITTVFVGSRDVAIVCSSFLIDSEVKITLAANECNDSMDKNSTASR